MTGATLPVRGHDEVATLTESVNQMQTSLRQLVAEMMTSSNEVAAAATEIDASSTEMSRGMQAQVNKVQDIRSGIANLSETAQSVNVQSSQATQLADRSGQQANADGTQVQDTIAAMESIAKVVEIGVKTVENLGDRSNQGHHEVTTGVGKAVTAGQSLQAIMEASGQVSQAIACIRQAAESQCLASLDIQNHADAIASVCEEAANGTKEATTAAGQLSIKAESLRSLCERFKL